MDKIIWTPLKVKPNYEIIFYVDERSVKHLRILEPMQNGVIY